MSCVADIRRALALRTAFPAVHPLELLDLVFEGRALLPAECTALEAPGGLSHEELAFVAAAFDRSFTETEWLDWQRPPADPQLQAAVRSMWTERMLPAFTIRYTGLARPPQPVERIPPLKAFRTL